jgi:chaperonin GroES
VTKIYVPTGSKVLVKPDAADATTPGGIVIPENAKERPREGVVLAQGGHVKQSLTLEVGVRVVFAKYAGTEIRQGEDVLLLLEEEEIIAVVKEE